MKVQRILKYTFVLVFVILFAGCYFVDEDLAETEPIAATLIPSATTIIVTPQPTTSPTVQPVVSPTLVPTLTPPVMETAVSPIAFFADDTDHAPITMPLHDNRVVWFARDNDLQRIDVNGIRSAILTSDGFLGWGLDEVDFRDLEPKLSPNGRYVAHLYDENTTRLLDVGMRTEVNLPGAWEVAWSPNSRYLAYVLLPKPLKPHAIVIYDVVTGQSLNLVEHERGSSDRFFFNLAWSPDGTQLAYNCCFTPREPYEGINDGELQVITLPAGDVEAVGAAESTVGGGPSPVCWHADGVVNAVRENALNCASDHSHQLFSALSSDGLLATWHSVTDENGEWVSTKIVVENQENGEILWELPLQTPTSLLLAWSPHDRFLFFSENGPNGSIWRVNADGSELIEFQQNARLLGVVWQWGNGASSLDISPDDHWWVKRTVSEPEEVGADELEQFPTGSKYFVDMFVKRQDGTQTWTAVSEYRAYGMGYDYPVPLKWDENGRYLYYTNVPVVDGCNVYTNGTDLWRLDLDTGETVQLMPKNGLVLALSPDNSQLAVDPSYGHGFLLVDLAGGAEQEFEVSTPVDAWDVGGMQWTPDGKHIVVLQVLEACIGEAKTAVLHIDVETLEVTTVMEPQSGQWRLIDWPENEQNIRLLDPEGSYWLLDIFSGEKTSSE